MPPALSHILSQQAKTAASPTQTCMVCLPTAINLWIGTFEHGIDLMDIKTGKVKKHYSVKQGNGLRSNFALCFTRTREGKIIVGTSEGLYYYDRPKDDFVLFPQVPVNSFITAVTESSDKVIWVATNNNGAFWIDLVSGAHGQFRI